MGYKIICDMCKKDADEATSIVESREFVHVHEGRKICINMELSVMEDYKTNAVDSEKPALCLDCAEIAIQGTFEQVRGFDGYA